jgi:hypothetical protein
MSSASLVRRDHRDLPSTFSFRRVLATVACVASLAVVAACDDDDEPTGLDVDGTYTLAQVNDQTVPVLVSTAFGDVLVTSGTAELDAGNYTGLITYTRDPDSDTPTTSTIALQGEYTEEGDAIEFTDNDLAIGQFTGRLDGNTLTADVNIAAFGITARLTFQRQE